MATRCPLPYPVGMKSLWQFCIEFFQDASWVIRRAYQNRNQ